MLCPGVAFEGGTVRPPRGCSAKEVSREMSCTAPYVSKARQRTRSDPLIQTHAKQRLVAPPTGLPSAQHAALYPAGPLPAPQSSQVSEVQG